MQKGESNTKRWQTNPLNTPKELQTQTYRGRSMDEEEREHDKQS